LACPGLGHVNRGFETFTRECFDALLADPRLDLSLFKGAGSATDQERPIWCLRRDQPMARMLGAAINRDGYYVEQTTFALALLPHLTRRPPDVVYFSDGAVGSLLWRWRRLIRGRFRLLLSNGGPLGPPNFPRFDHVHQVLSTHFAESVQAGRTPDSMTLLPYGFRIPADFQPPAPAARSALRRRLELPTDRPLLLTVGAVNHSHKRMDYVVREVAALPQPRPFLVMLGQREAETSAVLTLAHQLLGSAGFLCRTVPACEVRDYYDAADVFVLGSLMEGFGRVLVEAAARGLPCLAADQPFAREVLGSCGYFANLSRIGGLTDLLRQILAEGADLSRAIARQADVYARLSWDRLAPRYADMIVQVAGRLDRKGAVGR